MLQCLMVLRTLLRLLLLFALALPVQGQAMADSSPPCTAGGHHRSVEIGAEKSATGHTHHKDGPAACCCIPCVCLAAIVPEPLAVPAPVSGGGPIMVAVLFLPGLPGPGIDRPPRAERL